MNLNGFLAIRSSACNAKCHSLITKTRSQIDNSERLIQTVVIEEIRTCYHSYYTIRCSVNQDYKIKRINESTSPGVITIFLVYVLNEHILRALEVYWLKLRGNGSGYIAILKSGSHSICFNESSLKLVKNAVYFMSLFVFKIFEFLS